MSDVMPDPNDTSVLLSELLAMPLAALVHSDSVAARSLAKFVTEYGFEPAPEGAAPGTLGPLRTITFTYDTVDLDGRSVARQLTVPLLSLTPLPALSIREATLDFGIEVVGMFDHTNAPESGQASGPRLSSILGKELKVRVARDRQPSSPEQATPSRSDIRMHVLMTQSDLPTGITQLLSQLPESMVMRPSEMPAQIVAPDGPRLTATVVGDTPRLTRGASVEVVFRLRDADGRPLPGQDVFVQQGPHEYFLVPLDPLETDANGEARTSITLVRRPDKPVRALLIGFVTVRVSGMPDTDLSTHLPLDIRP